MEQQTTRLIAVYDSNLAPVIPMEDNLLHTNQTPFCPYPLACFCREDPELIAQVQSYVTAGLLTPDEATRLVAGKQL